MKICVVGAGYVGLVTGTCLAEMGNQVICVDNNADKVKSLEAGHVPIYEPGLEELIKYNRSDNRLLFTTDLKQAVESSDLCFIAVGTPQDEDGKADLRAVYGVGEEIAKAMTEYKVIVVKSTVPVGTCLALKRKMQAYSTHEFSVVSNPEFLKQGNAVTDFLKPDRIIIGCNDERSANIMKELYSSFMRTGNRLMVMDIASSEMTKYVANAFLATKISFMNDMSRISELVGADIEMVRYGISMDKRIGTQFLFPGLGYGGSCFPKDVKALNETGLEMQYESHILKAVDAINQEQRHYFIKKIIDVFGENLCGRTFAVWGLAFKPNTDDMREAPSVEIINALIDRGAKINAYDPKAIENAKQILPAAVNYQESKYDCLNQADALLLLTEWNEFRRPDFGRLIQMMSQNYLFDGRNQFDPEVMKQRGFKYISIGRLLIT